MKSNLPAVHLTRYSHMLYLYTLETVVKIPGVRKILVQVQRAFERRLGHAGRAASHGVSRFGLPSRGLFADGKSGREQFRFFNHFAPSTSSPRLAPSHRTGAEKVSRVDLWLVNIYLVQAFRDVNHFYSLYSS